MILRQQPLRRIPRPVRAVLASVALFTTVALVAACNSGDSDPADTATPADPTRTAQTPLPGSTAVAASPQPAGSQVPGNGQVVGIVGAVNEADNRIEINRLSGANVGAVLVTPATRILSGQGRPLTLGDLRPSDRIIASGEVLGAEMTADRVEIQPVLPGASPGG
jgi:hypothetical protein